MIDLDKREFHGHAHKMLRECLRKMGIEYGDDTPIVKGIPMHTTISPMQAV